MALVANTFEVKGTLGRWSTRYFTLIGSDTTLLLRTYQSEEAATQGRDPQSTRAISRVIDIGDREVARKNRFDLMLVRSNGSVSLAAPDADTKTAWLEAVTQVLGSSSRQLRSGSVPQTDLEVGDAADVAAAADAAAAAAAAIAAAEEDLGEVVVEKYRAAFDASEKDGDGVLNAAELSVLANDQLLHVLDEGEIEDMVAEVDGDGDGGLNFEEFLLAMRTRRWGLAPTAWDADAESSFLQMLNPSVYGGFRVRRTAERDAEVVGVFRWCDLEHNRIRVTEQREVNGDAWYKLHSSMYSALQAHDDYVEHDICEEGWLVSLYPGEVKAMYKNVPFDEPAPRRIERWDPVRVLAGRTEAGLTAELPSEEEAVLEKNVFFIRQDDHDSQPYRLYSYCNHHYYRAHELELIDEAKAGRQKLYSPCKERYEMVRSAFYKMEYSSGASCDWCRRGIAVGQERWFAPECQGDICFKCRPPCTGIPEPHENAPDKVEFHTMDEDGSKITFVIDADNAKLAYCVDDVLRIAAAKLLDQEGPLCNHQHRLEDQGEVPTYRWFCDISGEGCPVSEGSVEQIRRYRCSQCDYDVCAHCYDALVTQCEDNTVIVVGTACGEGGQTSAKIQAPTADDIGRVRALLRNAAGADAGAGNSADDADEALSNSSIPIKIGGLQHMLAPECKCPLSRICADSASMLMEGEVNHSHGDLSENRPEAGAVRCACCRKRSTSEDKPWLRCADCNFDLCPECSTDNVTVRYARHQAAGNIQEWWVFGCCCRRRGGAVISEAIVVAGAAATRPSLVTRAAITVATTSTTIVTTNTTTLLLPPPPSSSFSFRQPQRKWSPQAIQNPLQRVRVRWMPEAYS